VAVDNHSTDGTYEKLIGYVKSDDISVYRLEKRYLKTRLMLHANYLLRYTMHRYLTILNPGDMLYPNYLEICSGLMDDASHAEAMIIFCEVDFIDNEGRIFNQTPMFDKDRILEKERHLIEVFNQGMGHKVQCFYRVGTLPNILFELPHFVDFNDCFKKAWFLQFHNCIYIKNNLACICRSKYPDKIIDLASRLYMITRFKVYRDTVGNESTAFLDGLDSEEIYKNLSMLALQYASESLADGEIGTAKKILLFAEMVFEDIINTEFYSALKTLSLRENL